jgi:hypothetical protein
MNLDRVVITTFPGYFFSTILCLQSVRQHLPELAIDLIIDDFDLDAWPSYVQDCQQYIASQLPDVPITYHLFSSLPAVDQAQAGGWFRQQLIKLHLDQLLDSNHWALIDADVVLLDRPDFSTVPVLPRLPSPVDLGNRLYVEYMLGTPKPWLGDHSDFLCASGIPIRYISSTLLASLRHIVERNHAKNFLSLHLELIQQQHLVAFDANATKMVMSEFQLIEVYRNQFFKSPLPLRRGANAFTHTSIKDWNLQKDHFGDITIPEHHWQNLLCFGARHR